MKIKVDIWKRSRKTGGYLIDYHMVINDTDIEELALEKYKKQYNLDEETYEYSAQIDETIN